MRTNFKVTLFAIAVAAMLFCTGETQAQGRLGGLISKAIGGGSAPARGGPAIPAVMPPQRSIIPAIGGGSAPVTGGPAYPAVMPPQRNTGPSFGIQNGVPQMNVGVGQGANVSLDGNGGVGIGLDRVGGGMGIATIIERV